MKMLNTYKILAKFYQRGVQIGLADKLVDNVSMYAAVFDYDFAGGYSKWTARYRGSKMIQAVAYLREENAGCLTDSGHNEFWESETHYYRIHKADYTICKFKKPKTIGAWFFTEKEAKERAMQEIQALSKKENPEFDF